MRCAPTRDHRSRVRPRTGSNRLYAGRLRTAPRASALSERRGAGRPGTGSAAPLETSDLQAGDLHDLSGPDGRLGGKAEVLLSPESGQVLIEAATRFLRHVDPELVAEPDGGRRPVRRDGGAGCEVGAAIDGDAPDAGGPSFDCGPSAGENAQPPDPEAPNVSVASSQ